MNFKQDEVFALEKDAKKVSFRSSKYDGFQLIEAFYVDETGGRTSGLRLCCWI